MPGTTSRLALEYAVSTDEVSALPAIDLQAKTILDNAVIVTEGTYASLPAGSYAGQTYYATDTAQWWFYTGSAWQLVAPVLTCTVSQPTRSGGTAYQPNTARPTLVMLSLETTISGSGSATVSIGSSSSTSTEVVLIEEATSGGAAATFIVPPAWYYKATLTGTMVIQGTTEWVL